MEKFTAEGVRGLAGCTAQGQYSRVLLVVPRKYTTRSACVLSRGCCTASCGESSFGRSQHPCAGNYGEPSRQHAQKTGLPSGRSCLEGAPLQKETLTEPAQGQACLLDVPGAADCMPFAARWHQLSQHTVETEDVQCHPSRSLPTHSLSTSASL